MNYTEAVNYIEKSEKLGSIMGLERMKKLCDFLGNPQTKFSCIHVAGTNGKGSTAAMIAGILTCSGYKCGTLERVRRGKYWAYQLAEKVN